MNELQKLGIKAKILRSPYFTMGCMGDVGLHIASIKMEELESMMLAAKATLGKGTMEQQHATANGVETEKAQTAARFYHLEHAIIDYDACYDYVLQIIFFAFDFFTPLCSETDYSKNLRACRRGKSKFWRNFESLSHHNDNAKTLLDKYSTFDNQRTPKLAKWANRLKHHGGLNVEELASDRFSWSKLDDHNNVIFCSRWIQPMYVTINEVINELTQRNNDIVEFANWLYDFIGFSLCDQQTITGFLTINKSFSANNYGTR